MVIVGCDPGISQPGAAAIRRLDGYRVLAARSIKTDTKENLIARASAVWDLYADMVREFCPDLIVYEKQADLLAAARRGVVGFNASNHQTMATVGVIIGVSCAYRVPCIEIRKQTINVSVLGPGGGASASKAEIQKRIEMLCGVKLSQAKADAAAIAVAGAQRWQLEQARRIA